MSNLYLNPYEREVDLEMKETIMILAPHPDDETFGCGGTIVKKLEEGFSVIIIVITDGKYLYSTQLGVDCNPSPEEVKEIRKNEVINSINHGRIT